MYGVRTDGMEPNHVCMELELMVWEGPNHVCMELELTVWDLTTYVWS